MSDIPEAQNEVYRILHDLEHLRGTMREPVSLFREFHRRVTAAERERCIAQVQCGCPDGECHSIGNCSRDDVAAIRSSSK